MVLRKLKIREKGGCLSIWVRVPYTFRMKKKGSDLKFCNCRQCRRGKRTKYGSWLVQYYRRKYRHLVKRLLQQGAWEDIPSAYGVDYTD